MNIVLLIVFSTILAIGIAALFTAVEEFPEMDSVGTEENEQDIADANKDS